MKTKIEPFAPTGIIVTRLMNTIGLAGHEWRTYILNLVAHAMVAFAGYFLFGGWRLFKSRFTGGEAAAADTQFTLQHWVTLAVIGCVLVVVLAFKANIGMAAFTGAAG